MISGISFQTIFLRIGRSAEELLYPPCCPICDKVLPFHGGSICPDCEKKLPWVKEPFCVKCGKPIAKEQEEFCEDCQKDRHFFDCGRAAFFYNEQMRQSVGRMKFQNRRDYLDFYAASMVRAGAHLIESQSPEVIVPIPMYWKKRAKRGYNQAELLAERISRLTGIPCRKHLLRCLYSSGDQKALGREERLKNLYGTFALSGENETLPLSVLLVDDIYTTGSTLDEASRVLRAAGVRKIFFLALCTGKGKKPLHAPDSVLY